MTATPSGGDPQFSADLRHEAGVQPGEAPAETGHVSADIGAGHGTGSGSRWIIGLIIVIAVLAGAMMIAIGIGVFR